MTDAPGGYLPPSDRGLGDDRGLGNGAQTYAPTTNTATTYSTGETGEPSRTDTAKEQAGQLGQTAKQSGQQVASTAKDQARNVAQEGRRQAKDLTREVGNQVNQQAGAQKDKAATGLRSLSDELRSMAENSDQNGPVTDLAHQAAGKLGDAAQWLESREPGHLVEEVRDLARRRPGTFLIGAAVAGVLAGRLTRGAVQAARDDDSSDGTSTGYASTGYGSTATPQSGSFAGESYPADTYAGSATPIADETEADVLVVQDTTVAAGAYGTERDR